MMQVDKLTRFSNFIKKAEIIGLIIFLISYILCFYRVPFGGIAFTIIASFTAQFYMILNYFTIHNSNELNTSNSKNVFVILIGVFSGIFISMLITGTLFFMMLWPMGNIMYFVGTFFCSIFLILSIILFFISKNKNHLFFILKILFFIIIGLISYFVDRG